MSTSYPKIQIPQQQQQHSVKGIVGSNGNNKAYPAIMNYVDPSVDIAHVRRDTTGDDTPVEATWQSVPVQVHNARLRTNPPCRLEREGSELVQAPLADGGDTKSIDFMDTAQVMDDYYPLCEALLRQRLGPGVTVKAFDHNVRMAQPPSDTQLKNGGGSSVQSPLGVVHGDYTAVSAPRRIQDLAQPPKANDVWRSRLPAGQALLNDANDVAQAVAGQRRYALINVWRSIDREHPVTSYPLAFCNSQTVQSHHLRTLQIHYSDRVGENYLCTPSSSSDDDDDDESSLLHDWLFYPHMTFDEALLIKQWDSAAKDSTTSFCLHSAFGVPQDDDTPPRPRQSIEVRCVCLWDGQE